jgi:hypothetical protein
MTRAATLFAALLWIAQQRPGIFRIQPVRPVAELRAEVLQATPPSYRGGTAEQRTHRDLLRRAMERQGFTVFPSEWWHFDYRDWRQYGIQNQRFEDL